MEKILEYSTFEPTEEQKTALLGIAEILDNTVDVDSKTQEILLSGYAGCGKSSIAINIIKYRKHLFDNKTTILNGCYVLAPTNKAVQVLRNKLKGVDAELATTHLAIYGTPEIDPETGEYKWSVQSEFNKKLIIVDEASMLSKEIVDDLRLICKSCIIIYLGDNYQLEPVGKSNDLWHLPNKFQLTEVKRVNNTILKLATEIRTLRLNCFSQETEDIKIITEQKQFLQDFVSTFKEDSDSIILVATNQLRNDLNSYSRKLLGRVEQLEIGEKLISIANSSANSNGDMIVVKNIQFLETLEISLQEYNNMVDLTIHLYMINGQPSIFIPSYNKPSLYHGQIQKAINIEYILRYEVYQKSTFQNGIGVLDPRKLGKQVNIFTYGYCCSTHKAQGSEFNNVFVYQDYCARTWNGSKWFYTAITRSKNKLFILPNTKLQVQIEI